MKTQFILLALIPLLFTGCASIVDGGPKTIHFTSNPEGAKVSIYDRYNTQVSVITTPGAVALKPGGSYHKIWYRADFEFPGYYPYEAHINSKIDGWYWGNIVWGGFGLSGIVVSYALVDPITGNMWTLSPRNINCNFVSTALNLTPEQIKKAQLKANSTNTMVTAKKQEVIRK